MAEPTNASQVLEEVKSIRDTDMRDGLQRSIKNNVTGAAMGLVAGAMYGAYRKHNVFVTGLVGCILGDLGSYFLMGNE